MFLSSSFPLLVLSPSGCRCRLGGWTSALCAPCRKELGASCPWERMWAVWGRDRGVARLPRASHQRRDGAPLWKELPRPGLRSCRALRRREVESSARRQRAGKPRRAWNRPIPLLILFSSSLQPGPYGIHFWGSVLIEETRFAMQYRQLPHRSCPRASATHSTAIRAWKERLKLCYFAYSETHTHRLFN